MKKSSFDHEQLDVYQVSIEFAVLARGVVDRFPRERRDLFDQFSRASASISLNIAEGAGEYSKKEKARFYRIARRSATECAAILDICRRFGLVEESKFGQGRELLLRIVSMLTKLSQLGV